MANETIFSIINIAPILLNCFASIARNQVGWRVILSVDGKILMKDWLQYLACWLVLGGVITVLVMFARAAI